MKNLEIPALYDIFRTCSGVSTDSRKIEKGTMFFALKGENFNGNHFALHAAADLIVLAVDTSQWTSAEKHCSCQFLRMGQPLVDN